MYSVDYDNKGETRHLFNVKCRKGILGKAKLMLGILLAFILSGGGSLPTMAEGLRSVTATQYGEVQGTDEGEPKTSEEQEDRSAETKAAEEQQENNVEAKAAEEQQENNVEAKTDKEQEESSTVEQNGWITRNGKKYYYADGAYVTGWKTIKNKTYYFNKKGVLQTNKMISKNKYVNGKGVLVPKSEIFSHGKKSLKKLENKLKKELKKYRGTHSIYVKNLDTNEYLAINNAKMKPASVIKLYNMGTVYDQIEKGKLEETKSIKSYLNSMITVSSNDAYNELLGRIGQGNVRTGIGTVNKFCEEYGYKSTYCGGTLSPSYYTQVHLGGCRSAVKDCGHILEDIYRGTLVSEKASKKMLNLLKAQQRKGKIPAGLPKGVKSANKTGEDKSRQHDAAIVFSKNADYVIVIMTEGDGAAISHIQKLSAITYEYFN